ncbi:hypothetical protein Nmel_014785 [Mimus melanotis]
MLKLSSIYELNHSIWFWENNYTAFPSFNLFISGQVSFLNCWIRYHTLTYTAINTNQIPLSASITTAGCSLG